MKHAETLTVNTTSYHSYILKSLPPPTAQDGDGIFAAATVIMILNRPFLTHKNIKNFTIAPSPSFRIHKTQQRKVPLLVRQTETQLD